MDVRIPLFLFMLAQELSRPFLPLFFNQIYTPLGSLSQELTIGLPITTFMVMVLISIPIAGALTDRIAPRAMFVVGVLPSVAGHVGAALSGSIVEVLIWWTVAGLGYGIIFISAQAYVAHHTVQSSRAVGMSGFLGAVFAAFVCGPAIGGILADRLGYEQTLLVAAGLALFSAGAALVTVDPGAGLGFRSRRHSNRNWRRLLVQRDFVVLTLFSALPTKLVLGGLFFYLVPLFLTDLGNAQSNVGRIMMVFGIACVAITPLAARRSDRLERPRTLISLGGLVVGLGCLLPAFAGSTGGLLAAVALMGGGYALVTAPQLASIQQIAERGREFGVGPGVIVGSFRTLERIGTAAGAVVVGTAVTFVGYAEAMLLVGALVIACTIAFALLGMRHHERAVAA
jgi:predicted MFS family arabinose efflux permease